MMPLLEERRAVLVLLAGSHDLSNPLELGVNPPFRRGVTVVVTARRASLEASADLSEEFQLFFDDGVAQGSASL